tara:strand:+ start:23 stop:709 length:687 start_codon:yes stop_codon:yes gene_type:complete
MARKTHKHYAEEFGVREITFRGWLKKGAPYQNEAKMITWLNGLKTKSPEVRAWLKARGVKPTPKKAEASKPKHAKTAEDFRDHYQKELAIATDSNDQDQVKFWSELFLKQDESIRRSEIHAAKLGIDNGTVLPRAEVERILRAVFYASNACVQGQLTSICEQLVGYDNPGDMFHALKPAVVGGRLFSGLDKVMNTAGAPNVPGWVVDCIKLEAKQYLGNSESLWTKGK